MDNSFVILINHLEDGCVSSQALEQITKSLIKQALQVLKIKNVDRASPITNSVEKLLDTTQYLVKHNKSCFSHLKDVGFLDVIHGLLEIIVNRTKQETVSDDLQSLIELTTETVLVISDTNSQAKIDVVLQLLPGFLDVVQHQTLTFLNQLEILKAINSLLEQCPSQTKEEFLKNLINQKKIISLVHLIQTIGDYEFQVGAVEFLMRMFPRKARQHYAEIFITDKCMLSGFLAIKDKDFETDCRHFLNVINAKSEDPNQGVYSIPCLSAHIGNKELLKPSDINYNEFWVDFNIGSQRVTIFCEQNSLMSQNSNMDDDMWETVAVYKSDVLKCFCHVEDSSVILLEISLKSPVCDIYPSQHQDVRDNKIRIEFDLDLEMHVTHAVAQTFSVTERVNKVSTAENPLQISLREVQETDSQSLPSVPQSASTRVHTVNDMSSQGSSMRRHKVSIPSIPMCSPISSNGERCTSSHQKNCSDHEKTRKSTAHYNEPVPAKKLDKEQTVQKENKTNERHNGKNTGFAAPKTPTNKNTRSKGKIKTPVVLVNTLKEKEPAKVKEKKKEQSTRIDDVSVEKPVSKVVDPEIVIPDSLPLEQEFETMTKPGKKKVRVSVRRNEDSGIGADISTNSIQETSFSKQTEPDLRKDNTINEMVDGSAWPENSTDVDKGVSSADNSDNEITDDVIPEAADNLDTAWQISSDKMKEKKKENFDEIQCSMSNSFGFDTLNGNLDSIPDSFDNVEITEKNTVSERKQNSKKQQTNVNKKENRNKSKKSGKRKNEKDKDNVGASLSIECDTNTKSSKKNTGKLSFMKENESLKELYDFEEEEKRCSDSHKQVNKDFSHKKRDIGGKTGFESKTCKSDKDGAHEKTKKNKTEGKKKQKKRPKDEQQMSKMKNDEMMNSRNTVDLKDNETAIEKSDSRQTSRISSRSKVKKLCYKEYSESESETEDTMMSVTNKSNRSIQREGILSAKSLVDRKNTTVNNSNFLASPELSTNTHSSEIDNKRCEKEATNQSLSPGSKSHNCKNNKQRACHTAGEGNKKPKRSKRKREKEKECSVSEERFNSLIGSATTSEEESQDTSGGKRKENVFTHKIKNEDVLDDDCLSDSLYIEEDDSYNARRYRQEVCQLEKAHKKDKKLVTNKSTSNESSYKCDPKIASQKDSFSNAARGKKEKHKLLSKKNKNSHTQGDAVSNEKECSSYKGRVGFTDIDEVNESLDQPTVEAKSKSMVFQMSYSKTKTSYRSFDWVSEVPVKKQPSYDPYDFEANCDNASMASERHKRKDIVKALNSKHSFSGDSKEPKKKKANVKQGNRSISKSHRCADNMFQGFDVSSGVNDRAEPGNKNLLIQDKKSKKWFRKRNDKQQSESIENLQTVQNHMSEDISTDEDIYIHRQYEEQIDLDGSQAEKEVKDFSAIFRDLKNNSVHCEETRSCNNFLATPKTLAAVVDEVCGMDECGYDLATTSNLVTPLTCSPKAGSAKRGYKPLNVSVIKTPQSVAISEKKETESEEEEERKKKQVAKRSRRKRNSVKHKDISESDVEDGGNYYKPSKSFSSSPALDASLNTTRKSEKSWIAERKKVVKKIDASKTYKRQNPPTKQSVSPDEQSEEEESSINMEICSLPVPSVTKSVDLVSAPVTPFCKKSGRSDVSLDDLILSPVTPYKHALEEDDIQVVQTQENYALSLNTYNQDNLELDRFKTMDASLRKLLGDSGFASGPSTELRPSKSTLKRKFTISFLEYINLVESESSVANSDIQSEEEEKSTFVPKKLFRSEDMFQVSLKTPKALSVYSDQTEDTDVGFQYQTGLSSFITAFGADIQEQFKARKQRLETLTKETLKTTQNHFNQACAQQQQQQSLLHEEFMSKTMLELNELSKDIDRLKEAEKKTEEFYQYQLNVLRNNEQSQKARMVSMRKTHTGFKNTVNKLQRINQNVQVNTKDQLKKIMANMQHKLLRDVQKQELMNVKRGLQNMF